MGLFTFFHTLGLHLTVDLGTRALELCNDVRIGDARIARDLGIGDGDLPHPYR